MAKDQIRSRRRPAQAQMQQTKNLQATVNPTESCTLMKNLLRTAISQVAWLRNLFPEDNFKDKWLADMRIRAMYPQCQEARLLGQWLEYGVFDALDRKYLDTVIFGICDYRSKQLLEVYKFKVNYGENDEEGNEPTELVLTKTSEFSSSPKVNVKLPNKEDIKQETIRMVRSLVALAQTLKNLPTKRYLTMKLLYRDEYTPAHYQPKFFCDDSDSKDPFAFHASPMKFRVGKVTTPHHVMTLRLQTLADSFEEKEPVDDKREFDSQSSQSSTVEFWDPMVDSDDSEVESDFQSTDFTSLQNEEEVGSDHFSESEFENEEETYADQENTQTQSSVESSQIEQQSNESNDNKETDNDANDANNNINNNNSQEKEEEEEEEGQSEVEDVDSTQTQDFLYTQDLRQEQVNMEKLKNFIENKITNIKHLKIQLDKEFPDINADLIKKAMQEFKPKEAPTANAPQTSVRLAQFDTIYESFKDFVFSKRVCPSFKICKANKFGTDLAVKELYKRMEQDCLVYRDIKNKYRFMKQQNTQPTPVETVVEPFEFSEPSVVKESIQETATEIDDIGLSQAFMTKREAEVSVNRKRRLSQHEQEQADAQQLIETQVEHEVESQQEDSQGLPAHVRETMKFEDIELSQTEEVHKKRKISTIKKPIAQTPGK